eukprot:7388420-Prymnesium_polylepis.1
MDAVGAAITLCQAETVGLSFCQGPDASRPPKPLSKQDDASLHLRVPLSPVPPGRQAQPARFDDDETGFDDDEGFMDEDRHNGDHEAASDIDEPMLWLPSQTWPKQLPSQTWTKQLPSQTWPKQLQAKTTASSVPRIPPHMAANAHHALMRPTVNKVSAWCRKPIQLCSREIGAAINVVLRHAVWAGAVSADNALFPL